VHGHQGPWQVEARHQAGHLLPLDRRVECVDASVSSVSALVCRQRRRGPGSDARVVVGMRRWRGGSAPTQIPHAPWTAPSISRGTARVAGGGGKQASGADVGRGVAAIGGKGGGVLW
jgi:hypothetical protein